MLSLLFGEIFTVAIIQRATTGCLKRPQNYCCNIWGLDEKNPFGDGLLECVVALAVCVLG
jgi:hypothetical protein